MPTILLNYKYVHEKRSLQHMFTYIKANCPLHSGHGFRAPNAIPSLQRSNIYSNDSKHLITYKHYRTRDNFSWERIVSFFAKIFLANIHTHQNLFGICTDFSLFVKFFLINSFYLYGSPKFPPPNISHVRYIAIFITSL